MALMKNPKKCSDCGSDDIQLMGPTAFSIAGDGKSEQKVAVAFKCNNCSNLTFKLAPGQ